MRDHTKLKAFQLADEITIMIYRATSRFPKDEIYGLTSQMRRAAVSVASNIVEGCARDGQTEYHRFLEIAFSSLRELNYQAGLAICLGYIPEELFVECRARMMECEKVLGALVRLLVLPPVNPYHLIPQSVLIDPVLVKDKG